MRSSIIFAATAAAFVMPDAAVFNQIALQDETSQQKAIHQPISSSAESWWNHALDAVNVGSGAPAHGSATERLYKVVDDAINNAKDIVEDVSEDWKEMQNEFSSQLSSAVHKAKDTLTTTTTTLGGHHNFPDKTIYELIKLSDYTSKFAAIVDKHPAVVKVLNATDTKITLFAPIDEAFDKIPEHEHDKAGEEFIEAALLYHVGLGSYSARDLLKVRSIPTALTEDALGGEHQRLRTQLTLRGLTLNFYCKTVAVDIVSFP